ncbi:hypothetical protein JCM10213_006623 [Rhodosporidiobolus nylandii]
MGLFSKHDTTQAPAASVDQNYPPQSTTTTHSSGLFGKRKSTTTTSPPPAVYEEPVDNKHSGLFRKGTGKRRSSSDDSLPHDYRFSKHDSLSGAKTKLKAAQEAEKAADAALIRSRNAVKDARAEIVALEREAEMEARAAREKQKAAKGLKSEGNKLGRHM